MAEITQRLTGLVSACLLLVACASNGGQQPGAQAQANTLQAAAQASLYPATEPYQATLARLEQSREQAIADDKLLMLVLGADWCHDSRGFVHKIQDPAFAAQLGERYQVLLVNVGYLEYIRDIVQLYQVPVIYGTPTVLVIEPLTDTLLNRDSLPYWRNADNISMGNTLSYFDAYQPGQTLPTTATPSPALAAALDQIDQFEQQQAQRIFQAYAELGAIMRSMNPDRPSQEFLQKWSNLGQMRSSITSDLVSLRQQARAEDNAGRDPIKLDFPHYALFIDQATAAP